MRKLVSDLVLPLVVLVCAVLLGVLTGSVKLHYAALLSDPVFELRWIRVLAAFTVGGSLALGGLTFQAVLRNVLAEPFTLGISGGASVGAALAFVFGLTAKSFYAVPIMALICALVLLAMVLLLAKNKSPENLLLSGVIAGTVATSVLMYLVSTASSEDLAGITWWMLGDLQAVDTIFLYPATIVLAAGTLLLQFFARELNALALGAENAWSLGANPRFFTPFLIITASILAVQTVVLAGLIAFAGLIVPHLVRRFYGCDHRRIVWLTALWGGTFLIICDWLSRVISSKGELPIGVLTAAVGGSMFIYVLNKKRSSLL